MKYCKNCKYCKYEKFASLGINWAYFCLKTKKITFDEIGHRTTTLEYCTKRNEKFKCTDYKRKWYKFWIKGD